MSKPHVLLILDGWGINPKTEWNAIADAGTPNISKLWADYPHCRLKASGEDVGLPEGQIGSSEVGHMHLGSGRTIYQELVRINRAIEDKSFFKHPALVEAMAAAKGHTLHLWGLVSPGGVHSMDKHLYALLKMAKDAGLKRVFVHAFLDGRDVPPRSADAYLAELEAKMREYGVGKIGSISGRFYSMDRDKRWDRIEKSYEMLTEGKALKAKTARDALTTAYGRGENDEFVMPTLVDKDSLVHDGDSIIFFNFRGDRGRELTRAFVDDEFAGFVRKKKLAVRYVCMTEYDETIKHVEVAFAPKALVNILSDVVSNRGLKQLHIAETEKYAHVTFFFNGGREAPFPGEDRMLVQSPKVSTYDLKPEMSAYEVTDKVVAAIASGKYDLIVMNLANGDMVGHTGVWDASLKAVKVVDECVGKVRDAVAEQKGEMIVTADHGNVEQMQDYETRQPYTAHTLNDVPLILVADRFKKAKLRSVGGLFDVAPTLLQLMGIPVPKEMTGKSLIETK